MRKKLLAALVLLVVCGVLYLLRPKGDDKMPAAENPAGESPPVAETTVRQTAEPAINIKAVTIGEPAEAKATLRLSPAAHTYSSVEQVQPEVSYSQRRNNDERTLTPGVTYKPGEGINVKVDEDEKIQIGRDRYRSGEYQVRWKKTF